ncbi:hypothetical protein Hanom_Chr05g00456251 [Helianthus anomalus]
MEEDEHDTVNSGEDAEKVFSDDSPAPEKVKGINDNKCVENNLETISNGDNEHLMREIEVPNLEEEGVSFMLAVDFPFEDFVEENVEGQDFNTEGQQDVSKVNKRKKNKKGRAIGPVQQLVCQQ